jgi:hypothetical protein
MILTPIKTEQLQIQIESAAQQLKADALKVAAQITTVWDAESQNEAVTALKEITRLLKLAETSRTAVKAPVLEAGRTIDTVAKQFCAELDREQLRIKGLVNVFQTEQLKIAQEAERKKQEELKRIEEDRLKAEREIIAAQEKALLSETAKEVEQAQASKAQAEQSIQQLNMVATEVKLSPVVAPIKAAGAIVQTVKRFEVVDLHALYAHDKSLVRMEPNAAAINALLRAGFTRVPGLRIWEEVSTTVR